MSIRHCANPSSGSPDWAAAAIKGAATKRRRLSGKPKFAITVTLDAGVAQLGHDPGFSSSISVERLVRENSAL
jgi:hypothetical protein